MALWNPWHGCRKLSEGCANCYVYRSDARYERDSSRIYKTGDFGLPLKRNRAGEYKLSPDAGVVYTCFTSDFFLEDADEWRGEAWDMIRLRRDLRFLMITKRIHRFAQCVPEDWGGGWDHVAVCCTTENQDRADYRLPIYLEAPIKHKIIICEPLLGPVDLSPFLNESIEEVVAGGESGPFARVCDYDWVLDLRAQCVRAGVAFTFKQTGARFRKDGRLYRVERRFQHRQARKAGINFTSKKALNKN